MSWTSLTLNSLKQNSNPLCIRFCIFHHFNFEQNHGRKYFYKRTKAVKLVVYCRSRCSSQKSTNTISCIIEKELKSAENTPFYLFARRKMKLKLLEHNIVQITYHKSGDLMSFNNELEIGLQPIRHRNCKIKLKD